jgi:predicted enzyme related to lactoylglutathione lyase
MTYFLKPRPNRIFVVFAVLLMGATACTTASRPDLTGMSFSSEPLLGKVIWHDLITEDLDSARNFYGELLGWTFEDFNGGRGDNYIIARKDDVIVAGLLAIDAPTDDENYSRWLPYISVDDVDAALSRSIAGGASVVATARDVSIGRVAAIIDPQGAVVGLARTTIGDPDDTTTAAAPGRPVWTELLANDPQAAAAFYGSLAEYDARTITRRGGEYTILANGGVDRVGIFQNPADGE